jgi:hypothetical protein
MQPPHTRAGSGGMTGAAAALPAACRCLQRQGLEPFLPSPDAPRPRHTPQELMPPPAGRRRLGRLARPLAALGDTLALALVSSVPAPGVEGRGGAAALLPTASVTPPPTHTHTHTFTHPIPRRQGWPQGPIRAQSLPKPTTGSLVVVLFWAPKFIWPQGPRGGDRAAARGAGRCPACQRAARQLPQAVQGISGAACLEGGLVCMGAKAGKVEDP